MQAKPATAPHVADTLAAALHATSYTLLRNGRPYLLLSGCATRAEAEAIADRTAEAAARMGRPARYTIA